MGGRFAAILLYALLLANAARAQPASPTPLNDIAGRPDSAAIQAVVGRGLLAPKQPGVFDPTGAISRADFAAATQKLFALPPPAQPVWFADVPPSSPNYAAIEAVAPYVMRARAALCPTCMLSNSFGPQATLPRIQAIALLTQALAGTGRVTLATPGESEAALRGVAGVESLSAPGRQLVATALASKVAALGPNGTLDPGAPLDRANAAVLLNNAADVPPQRP